MVVYWVDCFLPPPQQRRELDSLRNRYQEQQESPAEKQPTTLGYGC